jgi:hypothetical protein
MPPCCFAVVLARGDRINIGAKLRLTLAIFADYAVADRQAKRLAFSR